MKHFGIAMKHTAEFTAMCSKDPSRAYADGSWTLDPEGVTCEECKATPEYKESLRHLNRLYKIHAEDQFICVDYNLHYQGEHCLSPILNFVKFDNSSPQVILQTLCRHPTISGDYRIVREFMKPTENTCKSCLENWKSMWHSIEHQINEQFDG